MLHFDSHLPVEAARNAEAHDFLGLVDGNDFDVKLAGHLTGEFFPVGLGRTEDSDFFQFAHFLERFQVTRRHAAGTEDADVAGIFAR